MTRNQPHPRRVGISVIVATLSAFLISCVILHAQTSEALITSNEPQIALQISTPNSDVMPSTPQTIGTQPLPDAVSWPFTTFLSIAISGALVSFCRLARKFQSYWKLGVFTNGWAVVYIFIGTLTGIFSIGIVYPIMPILRGHPNASSLIHGLAVFLGFVLPVLFPSVPILRQTKPVSGNIEAELPVSLSPNGLFNVLESKVKDCIKNRAASTFSKVAKQHDWKTIKQALYSTVREANAMREITEKNYSKAWEYISTLPDVDNHASDSDRKIDAIYYLQRLCEFRRFQYFLTSILQEDHV